MANLITEKQKKDIKVDYLTRLFAVSILILSLLGVFLLAYVVPYYISIGKKSIIVSERFTSAINAENKENVGESVSQVVRDTLDKMNVIELYNTNYISPSSYLLEIIDSKNQNIKISKFSFSNLDSKGKQILVSGVSKNREGLVAFIDSLKGNSNFSNVESPISDFAKDSDISFTLNIKLAI